VHTRRVPRIVLAGVAAVLAVAGLAGCRTSPQVAAYVGDETITVDQLQSAVDSRLEDDAVAAAVQAQPTAFTRQVLSLLVGEQVYADAAEHWGVTVTDDQVRERIDTLLQGQDPDQVYAQLAAQGIGREDVFENVRQQLYRQQIAHAEGLDDPLSDAALQQQYQQNQAQYQQWTLGYIAVPDQATADQVLAQLQADPASYPAVAAAYPNQITQPQLQTLTADNLPSAIADGVKSAAPGTGFTLPVQGAGVVVVFVAGATVQPFDAVRTQLEDAAASDVDAAAKKLVQDYRNGLHVTVNPRYGVLKDQAVVPADNGVVDILGGGSGSGSGAAASTTGG
jgi:SurA N-terminal domain/PPIC-type PPIASE domain